MPLRIDDLRRMQENRRYRENVLVPLEQKAVAPKTTVAVAKKLIRKIAKQDADRIVVRSDDAIRSLMNVATHSPSVQVRNAALMATVSVAGPQRRGSAEILNGVIDHTLGYTVMSRDLEETLDSIENGFEGDTYIPRDASLAGERYSASILRAVVKQASADEDPTYVLDHLRHRLEDLGAEIGPELKRILENANRQLETIARKSGRPETFGFGRFVEAAPARATA